MELPDYQASGGPLTARPNLGPQLSGALWLAKYRARPTSRTEWVRADKAVAFNANH